MSVEGRLSVGIRLPTSFEGIQLKYLMLWLYSEFGAVVLALFDAPTVKMAWAPGSGSHMILRLAM